MHTRWSAVPLTPVITAGADSRDAHPLLEGLRPPQLKGHLRFWNRILLGGVLGGDDRPLPKALDLMRRRESEWFGDTTAGGRLRARTWESPGADAPVQAHTRMNARDGSPVARPAIPAYSPNTDAPRFNISLSTPATGAPRIVITSLWLLFALGGVGARTRRGFGSLDVRPVDETTNRLCQELGLSFATADDLASIAQDYAGSLEQAHRIAASQAGVAAGAVPEVPSLRTGRARLYLVCPREKAWASWSAAMNEIRDRCYREYKDQVGTADGPFGKKQLGSASFMHIQIKRDGAGGFFGVLLAFRAENNSDPGWGKLDGVVKGTRWWVEEVALPA